MKFDRVACLLKVGSAVGRLAPYSIIDDRENWFFYFTNVNLKHETKLEFKRAPVAKGGVVRTPRTPPGDAYDHSQWPTCFEQSVPSAC